MQLENPNLEERYPPVPRRESHLHGLLIVNKPGLQELEQDSFPSTEPPRLYTSHDVVQRVRRWSDQRRIGHTGTLDPMASGVLVLCLGQATRLVEYYQGHDKTYYAEVTLGTATDSYDAMGEVIERAAVPPLTADTIRATLAQFTGEIMQLPPVYSALKQGGESLHRKVRRGEEVTVEPRPVTIYGIDLIAFEPPDRICLRVHCSAGTYIRSLAHDLGHALDSCGHLTLLRREAAGAFSIAESYTLAEIEAAATADQFASLLLPAGVHLAMPELVVDEEAATRLGQGQKVYLPTPATLLTTIQPSSLVKIVDNDAHFLGIGRCLKHNKVDAAAQPEPTLWKAEKWLATAE